MTKRLSFFGITAKDLNMNPNQPARKRKKRKSALTELAASARRRQARDRRTRAGLRHWKKLVSDYEHGRISSAVYLRRRRRLRELYPRV